MSLAWLAPPNGLVFKNQFQGLCFCYYASTEIVYEREPTIAIIRFSHLIFRAILNLFSSTSLHAFYSIMKVDVTKKTYNIYIMLPLIAYFSSLNIHAGIEQ